MTSAKLLPLYQLNAQRTTRSILNIWPYYKMNTHFLWSCVKQQPMLTLLIHQSPQQEDWDSSTVSSALKHFERLVETTRMTLLGPSCRETLTSALDTVVERTQDFTDSAYTTHEHRENILLLCDRAKLELNALLRIGNSMVSACTTEAAIPLSSSRWGQENSCFFISPHWGCEEFNLILTNTVQAKHHNSLTIIENWPRCGGDYPLALGIVTRCCAR